SSLVLSPPPLCSIPFLYTPLFRSAITLLVPTPRATGLSTTGPSFSSHTIRSTSSWVSHLIERRPDSVERAPYFAELVTNSAKYRSEEHTSELQSRGQLVCRLLLEK